jgi:hypothetical protein
MKLLGLLLLVTCAAGGALATANAGTNATPRTICHRASSAARPYVKLAVTARQLRGHLKHAADVIRTPTGPCPSSVMRPTSGGRAFTVSLTGEAEAPAGDPVGTGASTIRVRAGQGQLCFQLSVENLAAVAAHIHRGASGVAGPVVVPLATPAANGASRGCVPAARTIVAAILARPASYYVNVHTAEFPAGAVRGQLTGTSAASHGWVVAIDLKGTSEPNATGTAVMRVRQDAGMVCYRLHAANVTLPTVAAHIHRGGAGVNGPVVVPFTPPGQDGNSSGCANADAALIGEIVGSPAGFYVNVHTKEHPAGAIRAQLG